MQASILADLGPSPGITSTAPISSQAANVISSYQVSRSGSPSARPPGSESPRKVRKLFDYSKVTSNTSKPEQSSIKRELNIYLNDDFADDVCIFT